MTHKRCGGKLVSYTGPGRVPKSGFKANNENRWEDLFRCEKCRLVGIPF